MLTEKVPSEQNGWLPRVQHTLCVTGKVNRHLSKKMEKENEKNGKKKSESVKSLTYCEIFKNAFFYRTPPVAAESLKLVKLAKFQFQLFLTTLDIMGYLYIVT